ncbi:hypothetical protein E4P29_05405 [Rhodococcus sp. 1R11]|uniref:hypothetical protein n=1 Tax=Rhodococcus sp. 1R11 TaxID=2559614 RepID=UPI001072A291|nr:hypothetical protein [Rhodococcus sp. 1R11]TFI45153.1 hypothetical protein E4P29_05405 [Rhodococcus sp. 1R11]
MTTTEDTVKRNTAALLREAFARLDPATQRVMLDNPGTTAETVGESIEFSAAGIVYAVVDREALTDPEFDAKAGEWISTPDDLSKLDC